MVLNAVPRGIRRTGFSDDNNRVQVVIAFGSGSAFQQLQEIATARMQQFKLHRNPTNAAFKLQRKSGRGRVNTASLDGKR